MPAILTNASNFLLNSDYPLDKVVFMKSGSLAISAAPSGLLLITIPHGLGFIPLCGGNWSQSPDFSIAYEYSVGTFPSANPGAIFDTIANIYSDITNIYISIDNTKTSAQTLYYRVFAFAPSFDDSSVAPIASQGDSFLLNTSYNNTKLYLNDFVDLPATGGTPLNVTIVHGINDYIPQVVGWITNFGYVSPVGSSNMNASLTLMSANFSNINFSIPTFNPAQRAYYRVYLDA